MDTPICPGCHFACAIEDCQCARGERLHAQWTQTGELPARRGPGHGKGHGKGPSMPAIPVNDRIMHLLHIVGIALSDLADESGASAPERRAADCLMRHEKAATSRIIESRLRMPDVGSTLEALREQGLVEPHANGDSILYALTDRGVEQATEWEAERKAAEAAFLDVLDDEEKERLLALVVKILEPGFKRRQQQA